MKLRFVILSLSLFSGIVISAQGLAPQGIHYQAVVRNLMGEPLLNTQVRFRFSIETPQSTVLYRETQQATSNAIGGINVVVGQGVATTGDFSEINWRSGNLRMRVEMDPAGGQNFALFGLTPLQSVPYALYAQEAGGLSNTASIMPAQIGSGGASLGQVLRWMGSSWGPGNDQDNQQLSIIGNNLSLTNGGSVVLPIINYTGGTGISVSGSTIAALPVEPIWNAAELQGYSVSDAAPGQGEVLKWNGVSWTPSTDVGVSFVPGAGIELNGNILSAQTMTPIWNAATLRGTNVLPLTPSDGQYLRFSMTSGGWIPQTGGAELWTDLGNALYYLNNIGIGTAAPASRLHIAGGAFTIEDQTIAKSGTNSLEFSSNIIPVTDNNRDLGGNGRRWNTVWATNGMINTSDARDKTNIRPLAYGLHDILRLNPVAYEWSTGDVGHTKLGLLAQDVEAVIPEVISRPAEGTEADRLGIYYTDLIPVLIRAIQEQDAMIRQLQHEMEALRGN